MHKVPQDIQLQFKNAYSKKQLPNLQEYYQKWLRNQRTKGRGFKVAKYHCQIYPVINIRFFSKEIFLQLRSSPSPKAHRLIRVIFYMVRRTRSIRK